MRHVVSKNGAIIAISDVPLIKKDASEFHHRLDGFYDVDTADIPVKFKINDDGSLTQRHRSVSAKQMKVALVGNWKMRCGIATYNESLWPEIIKRVGDFRLFIEHNERPTGPTNVVGSVVVPQEKVVSCWRRGESLGVLVNAIKAYDPDVVLIQHEFGIWPNAAHWLSLMSQLGERRVIVTLHSVFHHRDKTIVEAAIPEIVTHLEGGKLVLVGEKGLTSPVYVIPHGCASADKERLWNFYDSNHTFMQFGFGFEYKGWELSIRTCAELKKKYKDVFFTGLFSESQFNKAGHQLYYDRLMKLISDLGVADNVALIRGYQSDAALDSYMRTNQAIVFPYVSHPAHEVFGASGAARLAMSKGIPVVTTSVNHFSDIPTVKADTVGDLAHALDRLFSNGLVRKDQVLKQFEYVEQNSWTNVAQMYVDVFEDVHR